MIQGGVVAQGECTVLQQAFSRRGTENQPTKGRCSWYNQPDIHDVIITGDTESCT